MKRLQSVPARAGYEKYREIVPPVRGIGGISGIVRAFLLVASIAVASCDGGTPKQLTEKPHPAKPRPAKPVQTKKERATAMQPKPATKVATKPATAAERPHSPVLRPGEGGDERTVPWVVEKLEPKIGAALKSRCGARKIAWPPARLTLLAFKRERRMEVWGANATGSFALLRSYTILAASGGIGPKRREGDRQVPEGFYRLSELNPRSSYHLSIRVGYPNGDDIAHAIVPRGGMGGDIYIHGSDVSIGCMALGDPAIEEVFLMAAVVPEPSRRIIIAPYDFRRSPRAPLPRSEEWVTELYRRIIAELRAFPRQGS